MEIKVYETKKYDTFKKLEGNRDVYGVNKIVESIKAVGYIPSPICVNEKMEVIDGQNRLEALKSLGMPIHYYVVKGIGIEEARQLNIGRKNWTPMDYLKSYAASGNENYIRFLEFYEKHDNYSLQELWGVLKGVILCNGWVTYSFKVGELKLSAEEVKEAEKTIGYLDEAKPYLNKLEGSRRMAITAIAWVLAHTKADKNRVVRIVQSKYPLFIPVVSAETFLKDFGNHYNKRVQASNQVWFDVEYRMSLKNTEKE